jgi:hypothetical protein
MEHADREFTGDKLLQLANDIEAAVGGNNAGLTPLGMTVIQMAEAAVSRDALASAQGTTK